MIKQQIFIPVSTQDVYRALMDEKLHSKFTGAKAKIQNKVGGKFSVWDGYAAVNQINVVDEKTDDFVKTIKEARRTYSNVNDGNVYYNGIVWSPK